MWLRHDRAASSGDASKLIGIVPVGGFRYDPPFSRNPFSLEPRTIMSINKTKRATVSHWVIGKLIPWSQRVDKFRARGSYSGFHRTAHVKSDPLAKSRIEFEDHANLLENFPDFDLLDAVVDKRVLDYGCGYGGRTAWFGKFARSVEGIEVRPKLVETAQAFVAEQKITNVGFRVSDQTTIPYPDNEFDLAFSFDVLEHVADPRETLDELMRVVKPGGQLILIFTPYYGIFSHHLNYISLFPGLHWFFTPEQLVETVNHLLAHDPEFQRLDVSPQPPPSVSYNGRRKCLPTLNGLTRQEYVGLLAERDLEVVHLRSTPILEKFPLGGKLGVAINRGLHRLPMGKELFSHNLVSVLRNNKRAVRLPVGNGPHLCGADRNPKHELVIA